MPPFLNSTQPSDHNISPTPYQPPHNANPATTMNPAPRIPAIPVAIAAAPVELADVPAAVAECVIPLMEPLMDMDIEEPPSSPAKLSWLVHVAEKLELEFEHEEPMVSFAPATHETAAH